MLGVLGSLTQQCLSRHSLSKNLLITRVSIGVSTPFEAVSHGIPLPKEQRRFVALKFNGEILHTSEGNNDVIEFLESNSGLIAFLKLTVDACITTQQQSDYVERNNLDMDAITTGKLAGQAFELQNTLGKIVYIEFD